MKPATLVILALGAVAFGVIAFAVVLHIAGPKSAAQAKRAVFKVGSAKSLAKAVDRNGPLLFQDLLNQSRDIYVQHLSGNDWIGFEAHAPDEARRCVLTWVAASHTFHDPCSNRVYPGDGTGLTRYAATVDKQGLLSVDLRVPLPEDAAATTSPTTTVG